MVSETDDIGDYEHYFVSEVRQIVIDQFFTVKTVLPVCRERIKAASIRKEKVLGNQNDEYFSELCFTERSKNEDLSEFDCT